jgi:hypothetical protein
VGGGEERHAVRSPLTRGWISLHFRSARRWAARDGAERAGTPGDGEGCRRVVCARHGRCSGPGGDGRGPAGEPVVRPVKSLALSMKVHGDLSVPRIPSVALTCGFAVARRVGTGYLPAVRSLSRPCRICLNGERDNVKVHLDVAVQPSPLRGTFAIAHVQSASLGRTAPMPKGWWPTTDSSLHGSPAERAVRAVARAGPAARPASRDRHRARRQPPHRPAPPHPPVVQVLVHVCEAELGQACLAPLGRPRLLLGSPGRVGRGALALGRHHPPNLVLVDRRRRVPRAAPSSAATSASVHAWATSRSARYARTVLKPSSRTRAAARCWAACWRWRASCWRRGGWRT